MLFRLVRDSVEYLSANRSPTFDRNVWLGRSVFRIQLEPAFEAGPGVRKDGFGRTLRLAHTAELASGQYRGGFTSAAYGGAEVDQGLLYGFER